MNAQGASGASFNISTSGVNVPLSDYQILNGFTADGSNEAFTVPQTGTYLLSYHVEPTAAIQLTTQILQNDVPLNGSTLAAATPMANYNMLLLANLKENDKISLHVSGTTATVDLLKADLTAIRMA